MRALYGRSRAASAAAVSGRAVLAITVPRLLDPLSVAPTGVADNPILAAKTELGNAGPSAPLNNSMAQKSSSAPSGLVARHLDPERQASTDSLVGQGSAAQPHKPLRVRSPALNGLFTLA